MSIVVAFSGGLDTSFCVPYLKEAYGQPVTTVTVNTGGLTPDDCTRIERRSLELGAAEHRLVDGRMSLFDKALQYLIKGNVLRGGVYPLCVGPDRVVQAEKLVEEALRIGTTQVAHGSTGAGNDQIRFDVALSVLGDGLDILTPIRDQGLSRKETTRFLTERGFKVDADTTAYSINTGLWGTTVGGRETLTTEESLPDEAWPWPAPAEAPGEGVTLSIQFDRGIPVAIDGAACGPVALIETLNTVGFDHGIGRAIHVGDTILGIKGRVGFQAPAAALLIPAHRELEKIVLTRWQQFHKGQLGEFYGMMMHEAQYFDPVMRDIEAMLDSSQRTVSGSVRLHLCRGHVDVLGVSSPCSLFDSSIATYGETNMLWNGRDARGFAQILGVQSMLAASSHQTMTRS